jgi:hypothetical protein
MVPMAALVVTQIALLSTVPTELSLTVTESPGNTGSGERLMLAMGWIGPVQAVKSICWVTL